MLATMPSFPPIFSFGLPSPYQPAVPSPLSSSPIRASQSSPPLSPRDTNTLPRRDFNSSPIKGPKFKFTAQDVKKNPLKQSRETVQESRRKLFLKNVRQRADDKQWQRRGGDQEVLKLEWSTFERMRRQQKNADIDGLVFEDELDDIPEIVEEQAPPEDFDEMMVDSHAQREEAELDAMFSTYEAQSSSQQRPERPASPSLSDDDDYDSLFMDLLSQQQSSQSIVLSGQMDMS